MFAVIQAGAHQYRVQEGDELLVDKVEGKEGDAIVFSNVLMLGGLSGAEPVRVGAPAVMGASVSAVICKQQRQAKILVFKYRRRKNSKKKQGHRQRLTLVKISKIAAAV